MWMVRGSRPFITPPRYVRVVVHAPEDVTSIAEEHAKIRVGLHVLGNVQPVLVHVVVVV
jgi:hypothetical protein